ncbi:hypothetical protein A3K24_00315 [candidate division Kazan bacterium RIFCSPHIGHO2_01_FULL_44_14]|uniref:DUF4145 domain-containing protein n=1 Tax=candidate division Kazan bacterium RIFCSPLOWO2_01_FULL_45_19 TaxID=1798538 RepID=A0A1F4NQY9_UNCK3|nr:MAG: hypothetical protein A3K51_00315 [candidate division Kazan bacterium RIFCSPLOWO2_01_FULL_45_19]OGB77557.1 MAG: hypothetical protein A3K24_00315 [candidate division Kazan bacterium RIFCSPHIGHO2_01_FULL_44_14]
MIYGWIIFIVTLVGGGLLLYAISKKRTLSDADKAKIQRTWINLELLIEGDNESEWVKAIFEADKLLNYVLQQRQVAGSNLGERLRNSRSLFGNVDVAWQAHKVRNELAHNIDTRLTRLQVERTIDNFRRALKQLGAL